MAGSAAASSASGPAASSRASRRAANARRGSATRYQARGAAPGGVCGASHASGLSSAVDADAPEQ